MELLPSEDGSQVVDLSIEDFFADRGARQEPQDEKSKKVSLFPRSL